MRDDFRLAFVMRFCSNRDFLPFMNAKLFKDVIALIMFTGRIFLICTLFNPLRSVLLPNLMHDFITLSNATSYGPRREKTCLRGFRPGSTQTGLYSHREWLEASNFGFRK